MGGRDLQVVNTSSFVLGKAPVSKCSAHLCSYVLQERSSTHAHHAERAALCSAPIREGWGGEAIRSSREAVRGEGGGA